MSQSAVKVPLETLQKFQRHSRALYKALVRYSNAVPDSTKRLRYLTQIRKEFRYYRNETDEERIQKLLKKGEGRLGFIRMQVPTSKIPMSDRIPRNDNPNGDLVTVYAWDEKENKIVSDVSRVINTAQFSHWRDFNPDPDEKRKHEHLIERFHYRGDYWEKRRRGWLPQDILDMYPGGPTLSEMMMERDKHETDWHLPTSDIRDHPEVREALGDFEDKEDYWWHRTSIRGLENEPDIVAIQKKATETVDPKDIMPGWAQDYNHLKQRRASGAPHITEWLAGRRLK